MLYFSAMNYTLNELGIELDSLPNEEWRYVPNTNNRYLVSNMGRLLTTGYRGSKRCSIMKPAKDANGYYRTMLLIDDKLKTIKVHRIVAQTWIENPLNKLQVNHIDFVRDNNAVSNLEWTTAKENTLHSYNNGRIKKPICTNFVKGSKVGTAKLNEEQVKEIRLKFKPRIYTREMLAKEYGVSPHTIKDVILRRWQHVK
jgi:hypothetical protein